MFLAIVILTSMLSALLCIQSTPVNVDNKTIVPDTESAVLQEFYNSVKEMLPVKNEDSQTPNEDDFSQNDNENDTLSGFIDDFLRNVTSNETDSNISEAIIEKWDVEEVQLSDEDNVPEDDNENDAQFDINDDFSGNGTDTSLDVFEGFSAIPDVIEYQTAQKYVFPEKYKQREMPPKGQFHHRRFPDYYNMKGTPYGTHGGFSRHSNPKGTPYDAHKGYFGNLNPKGTPYDSYEGFLGNSNPKGTPYNPYGDFSGNSNPREIRPDIYDFLLDNLNLKDLPFYADETLPNQLTWKGMPSDIYRNLPEKSNWNDISPDIYRSFPEIFNWKGGKKVIR